MKQSGFFSGFVVMLMACSLSLQARVAEPRKTQPLLTHDIPLNPNNLPRPFSSKRLKHCAPHRAWDVAWSSDNSRIAIAIGSGLGTADCPYSGAVQGFRMDGNKPPELLYTLDSADFVRSVDINPVNGWLAAAGEKVRIYDLDSGRLLYTLEDTASQMTRVVFSPDGYHLAATGGREYKLWIYNMVSLASPEYTITHATDWLLSVAYSPDGRYIGTVGLDSIIRIYRSGDPATPWYSFSAEQYHEGVNDIDFYNSTLLALAASTHALIYGLPVFSQLYDLHGIQQVVRSVEFSGNDQWLAVSGEKGIRIFDKENPVAPRFSLTEPKDAVRDVRFSSDSRYLAAAVAREGQNVLIYRMPAVDSETDDEDSTEPDRMTVNAGLPSATDIPAGSGQPAATESICLSSEPVTFDDNCYPLATLISLNDYRNQKACLKNLLDEARERMAECEKRTKETKNIISSLCDHIECPAWESGLSVRYHNIDSKTFSTYTLLLGQLWRIRLEKHSYFKKADTLNKRLSKLSPLLFALRGIESETIKLAFPMP